MKTKILKKILAIFCVISILVATSSEVLATAVAIVSGTKATMGIELLHKSKYINGNDGISFGYNVDNRNVYRVYSGDQDYETTILCLDMNGKFPQETDTTGTISNTGEYESLGEATSETLASVNSSITDKDAEKIKWLIENALLPEDSDSMREQKLAQIFNSLIDSTSTDANPLTLNQIKSVLTEDDVVFALQIALWEVTNDLSYTSINGTTDGTNWNEIDEDKLNYIEYIINYYETYFTEIDDGTLTKDSSTNTETLSVNGTENATATVDGNYVFIGPFSISNYSDYYTIDLSFEDESGNSIATTAYLLTTSASNTTTVLTQTKEGLEGKEFYVRLKKSTDVRKIKFSLTTETKVMSAVGTVWENETSGSQAMLTIQREIQEGTEVTAEASFELETIKYDVSLRKYISGIKRKNDSGEWVTYDLDDSREPTIIESSSSENEETFNQYEYLHSKDPVEVQVGDRVIYTIIVRNEGTEDVIVKSITDYLPTSGLEYAKEDSINTDNSWIASNADETGATQKAVTTITSTIKLEPGEQTPVEIVCEVTESAKGKVITNIAEISEISSTDNKTITDRDSETNNINLPTTETEWENYQGNSTTQYSNPTDLSKNNYYYKGQEDDDDFEKIVVAGTIDLALRKSISTVNGSEKSRAQDPDTSPLTDGDDSTTTSNFTDTKTPVSVKAGDVVVYTIRIYNEGQEDAYAGKIEDYIPEGLGFLPQLQLNIDNGWIASGEVTSKKLSEITNGTTNLSQSDFSSDVTDYKEAAVIIGQATISTTKLKDTVISAYDKSTDILSYKTVQVACIVLDTVETDTIIKNIAAITEYKDSEGNVVEEDTDSDTKTTINPATYPDSTTIQDDDDFEKLILQDTVYDLALKKFVSGVTSSDGSAKTISDNQKRTITVTDVSQLTSRTTSSETGDAIYSIDKSIPVDVSKGDYVTYTIRVYNEGLEEAFVNEIVDSIPEGLEFVTYETNSDGSYKSGSYTNWTYGWKTFSEANATTGWQTGIKTTYLSETTIPAFDSAKSEEEGKGLSYKEIKIELKVTTSENSEIKNIAEITEDDGDDNDSTPNNKEETEDDEDYDIIIPQTFDLALRKFITQIDDTEITDREPEVTYEDGKLIYTHTKEPEIVVNGNAVTYTIRVYNEGTLDGYASLIQDDLPEGLTFLPEDDTNVEYRWKMYDEDGNETDDVTEAVTIKTDYLSKEQGKITTTDENSSETEGKSESEANTSTEENSNLIKAFDLNSGSIDYRDIKVVFEVTQESVTDGNTTLINTAEIAEDTDEYGNEIDDIDSTPKNGEENEDDIDKEYLELKYFDLSLLKYVSKVIVTEDGVTKETETGYDGTENPEPLVKVEVSEFGVENTEIKYVYTIKITNEGQIEGCATEIKDRIPDGLEFYEEDNTEYGWTVEEDGIVTTNYLQDILLEPGESVELQIILRWVKDEENLGQKINIAEISEDYNEYGVADIDSTTDNNLDGEDDQDSAIVVLSTTTGATPLYIILIISIIAIICGGFYLIYNKVVKP